MKTLLISLFAILALSGTSFASSYGQAVPFSNYSATSGTAVKSSVFNVRGFGKKTVTVQGIAVSGHANAALAGTVLVECGPTSNGPWNTCIANGYAQTAVSTTSNAIFTWSDASAYIRASWAKTTGEVSVWLNWTED